MANHEGIARYLEWLRDENKQDYLDKLVWELTRVTDGFVDNKPTSGTRQFLLLHGDAWRPNQGKDEFLALYNALNSRPEFTKIEHNLPNTEGINLFKDRNVIAVLATDKQIAYTEIPIVKTMREEYTEVRAQGELEWRVQAYHTFRCEQEIWNLEHARVQETHTIDIPLTSGAYYRLLDEPERVRLFVKALAVGIVREQEHALGGKLWVCGPVGSDRPIQLTEVDQDLFRALVTFVQNKKDIRQQQKGALELRPIEGLIIEAVRASSKSFSEHAKTFRAEHADLFEIVMDHTGQDYADPRKAFIALVLDYYLK